VDEAEVAVCGFILAGCQSASALEFVEAAFDHVAQGVDGGIDGQLDQPIALGRDHRDTAAPFHILANEVSIIALVGQQHLGCWPVGVHDRQIAFVIGDFAAGQGKGYGQAQRIDAEMDLGRKATF
jgi:hypothetical protein